MTKKQFLPLLGMTIAAFIFNTSEFMPVGLLSDIATSFHITQTQAGIMITTYSWAVMILSLPLMLLACKFDYKKILLITLFLFFIGQICTGLCQSFFLLILSRLVVACAHAMFWSIASVIAVLLVNKEKREFAMSMIVTGTSVAMIFGLPLGRSIGLILGWRSTFQIVGIISLCVFIFQFFYFPTLPKPQPFTLKQLPSLLHNKKLIFIYILSLLFATAYYTAYSYIEPFLSQIAHLNNLEITCALSIFGCAGILGSFLFSKFYTKNRNVFLNSTLVFMTFVLILLQPSSFTYITICILCILWGMTSTAFNVACQSEVILASDASSSSVAMSIFSGIFNLGIGLGSFIGGQTIEILHISFIGYIGAIIISLGLIFSIRQS